MKSDALRFGVWICPGLELKAKISEKTEAAVSIQAEAGFCSGKVLSKVELASSAMY